MPILMIHLLTFTETRPGYPPTMRAICGHKSETKKEFSLSLEKVTCAECLRLADHKLGATT